MPKKLEKEQYTKAEVEELLRKQSEELNERVEVSEMVAEMTDAEKRHYNSLDGNAQNEFLFMDSSERATVLKGVEDSNPVIYTATNGSEYRKNDDPRLVQMAKDRDKERKDFLKMKQENEQAEFEKRAALELPNLPGEVKTHAAILKAVETLRGAALDTLKAHNARMGDTLREVGKRGTDYTPKLEGADTSAHEELDKMTKELIKKNPELEYYAAYEKVATANPQLVQRAVEEG